MPLAWRFSPWWMYWLMPSMWMSSSLNAEDDALSAQRATSSQFFCNMMFGDVQRRRARVQRMCVGWAFNDGADAFHETGLG